MLSKIKNLEVKAQKVKQNNQKNFCEFSKKLNQLTVAHQKQCEN
jgi:hypothetical protein